MISSIRVPLGTTRRRVLWYRVFFCGTAVAAWGRKETEPRKETFGEKTEASEVEGERTEAKKGEPEAPWDGPYLKYRTDRPPQLGQNYQCS